VTLTCAEPFAGAGGLAIGLVRAGFKCVYATDKDRDAVGTLAQSVDAADCIMHSPETIAPFARAVGARTARLDLLAGGVPCQPFSQPGLNLGHLDPRDCSPHFTKMTQAIEPRAFMIENVMSLMNSKHLPYLETVLAEMRKSYTIDFRVLCAADYGAPQMRRRVIIVGFRDPAAAARFRWPTRTHGEAELGAAKWRAEGRGSYWTEHGLGGNPWSFASTSTGTHCPRMAVISARVSTSRRVRQRSRPPRSPFSSSGVAATTTLGSPRNFAANGRTTQIVGEGRSALVMNDRLKPVPPPAFCFLLAASNTLARSSTATARAAVARAAASTAGAYHAATAWRSRARGR
jgi:hypothetical protein